MAILDDFGVTDVSVQIPRGVYHGAALVAHKIRRPVNRLIETIYIVENYTRSYLGGQSKYTDHQKIVKRCYALPYRTLEIFKKKFGG